MCVHVEIKQTKSVRKSYGSPVVGPTVQEIIAGEAVGGDVTAVGKSEEVVPAYESLCICCLSTCAILPILCFGDH